MNLHQLLGRVFYKVLAPIWTITLGRRERARVIIVSSDGTQILLVKNWLSSQKWMLPGGGIKSNEEAPTAAAREIKEELGLNIDPTHIDLIGKVGVEDGSARYVSVCLRVKIGTPNFKINRRELIDASWFKLDILPNNRSNVVDKALALNRVSVDNSAHIA